jgi:hypothetical protein
MLSLLINMPTSEPISVGEYLHTSYSPDCDYLDGLVMERNPESGVTQISKAR